MSIHRKIGQITDKIKDMVNMIDMSVAGDKPGREELTEDQQQELGVMILKMHDNELEQKGCSRLQKWLTTDRRALRFYVDFTQMCASLRNLFGKTQAQPEKPMAKTHH